MQYDKDARIWYCTLGSLAYCVDVALSPNTTMTESDCAKTIPSNGNTKPVQKPEDTANAVVRLNVGGVLYTTTAGTLLYCKNSVLQQLAQSYLVQPNATPQLLDRDPDTFAHVLRYLRAARFGGTVLPNDIAIRRALSIEAIALRLPSLTKALSDTAARSFRRAVVVCEKHTLFVDGAAVGGHFFVCGKRSSTSWFGGFSEDGLARQFQERVEAAIKETSDKTGLGLAHTATAAATSLDDVDAKDKPRLRHILTITLTFEPRK